MNGSTPARNPPTATLAAHHGRQAVFKDQRRVEVLHLQEPLGGLFQGQLGDQPDDFARDRHNAVARGLALHELEDAMDGRLLKVGQIHRDLGQAAHQESRALDVAQPAGGEAHRLGNLLGDGHVGRVQEDVVGHQRLARADHRGSGGWVHARLAEVGFAGGVGGDLVANALELAAANVFKILPFGRGGGGLVEINRNREPPGDLGADVLGHGHAVFNRDAVDGDEGNHIGRRPCAGARPGAGSGRSARRPCPRRAERPPEWLPARRRW